MAVINFKSIFTQFSISNYFSYLRTLKIRWLFNLFHEYDAGVDFHKLMIFFFAVEFILFVDVTLVLYFSYFLTLYYDTS